MARVKVEPAGPIIEVRMGSNLARVLEEAGIPLATWCGHRGICGRCEVEIVSGRVPKPKPKEVFFQQRRGWPSSHRLACLFSVEGDLVIRVPESSLMTEMPVLKAALEIKHTIEPAVKRYVFSLPPINLKKPDSTLGRLQKALHQPRLRASLRVLSNIGWLKQDRVEVQAAVYEDEEILALSPAALPYPILGLAVDLGTTTIVLEALDLEDGRILAEEVAINPQHRFGADVLSRIAHASLGKKQRKELQTALVEGLNQLIKKIKAQLKVDGENILEVVLAGNSTMNHLLLGLPVDSLAQSPFATVFSSLPPLRAEDIGLKVNPAAKVYLAPNLRSFIGGDISAGLMAANLFEAEGPFAFIDLGTNGEIVVKGEKRLVATSTAAGPAFEGGNLSCGLPASSGAIERVDWAEDGFKIKTINDAEPRGICGSGLIDLLSVLLRKGMIYANGRLAMAKEKMAVVPGLFLTQEDIRQAQLACAAIKTGFQLLLAYLHLQPQDLRAIYIAGAFGQELSVANSQAIGLIPRVSPERVFFLGNTSLAGARLLLLNRLSRQRLLSRLERVEYVSLALEKQFQNYFLENLKLGPWP